MHHFDTPSRHSELTVTAGAHVQVDPLPPLPAALDAPRGTTLRQSAERGEHWDFLHPSRFAAWTPSLREFVSVIGTEVTAAADPLTTVRRLVAAVHQAFEYVPKSTRVDSPIDEALAARRGVCQDFAHIMLASGRMLGLPCRYVSGYIAPRPAERPRAARRQRDARLGRGDAARPRLGGLRSHQQRRSRACATSASPSAATTPTFRQRAASTRAAPTSALAVSVDVTPSDAPSALEPMLPEPQWATEEVAAPIDANAERDMQSQQQQQQSATAIGPSFRLRR